MQPMERLTPDALAAVILQAPGWARLGITVRDPRLREHAARTLASRIIASLDGDDGNDERQLALPIA